MKWYALFTALVLTGCFGVDPKNGTYACEHTGTDCPDQYHCAVNDTCWKDGQDPDLGAAGSDLGPDPSPDLGPDPSPDLAPDLAPSGSPADCSDGRKDDDETDVDCGGPACAKCGAALGCNGDDDCASGFCNVVTRTCVATQCDDGQTDGRETDVDCGGGDCPPCAVNQLCRGNIDCTTASCVKMTCALMSGPPSWVKVDAMPTAHAQGIVTVAGNNKLYSIFGYADNGALSSNVDEYDFNTKKWTNHPSPTDAYAVGMASGARGADGNIYVVSGFGLNTPDAVATNQVYWPSLARFDSATGLDTPRRSHAATSGPDGRIWLSGGLLANSTLTKTVEAYDTATKTWQHLPDMLNARYLHAMTTGPDGKIYVIGGRQALWRVEAYDPATNKWAAVASLDQGLPGGLAAATGQDGRIYAISGDELMTTVEAYTPATNKWVPVASLKTARNNLGAAVGPDGLIYAVGGTDAAGASLTTVESYGPRFFLSVTTTRANMPVTVGGAWNFAANASVKVFLGDTSRPPLGTGVTDGAGNLRPIQFTVPADTKPGTYTVTVIDSHSLYPALATLIIMP